MSPDTNVAVVGLGYVGLPLAIAFAEAGHQVVGIDISAPRIAQLNERRSPIDDISDERLAAALDNGSLCVMERRRRPRRDERASSCASRRRSRRPRTPTSSRCSPRRRFIRDQLRAGQLIVLQSTTFPGTTTGPFRTVLEGVGAGRRARLRPRVRARSVSTRAIPPAPRRTVPRLVGGSTPAATARAAALLGRINDRVIAPLLARRRRDGEAAREHVPQRQHRVRQPARAPVRADGARRVGGHRRRGHQAVRVHALHARSRRRRATASRVDPYYLAWRAREFDFTDRFIELAGDINFAMPRHVVDLVAEALNDRGKALKRLPRRRAGRGVQARRPGRAQLAGGRRARASSPSNGAEVALPRPARGLVPGRRRASCTRAAGSDALIDWADVIVVLVAHRAIDWDHVYGAARPGGRHGQQFPRASDPRSAGPSPRRGLVERRLRVRLRPCTWCCPGPRRTQATS